MVGLWWVFVVSFLACTHANIDSCFPKEVPEVPDPDLPKDLAKFSLSLFKKLVAVSEAERSKKSKVTARQGKDEGTGRSENWRGKRQRIPGRVEVSTSGESLMAGQSDASSSIVLSPYSVWNVLILAYMGAEGKTRNQLAKALRLPSKTASHANWVFVRQMLSDETVGRRFNRNKRSRGSSRQELAASKVGQKNSILTSSSRAYFAENINIEPCLLKNLPEITRIDFSNSRTAAEIINNHVRSATNGEIESLVQASDLVRAEFLLLNAVYFKGSWKTIFPSENTALTTFRATPHLALDLVPMMRVIGQFKYAPMTSLNATLLELPYTTGFCMLVLLPAMDVWRPEEVVRRLSYRKLEDARAFMQQTEIEVSLPKFNLTSRMSNELKKALGDMGISDIFTGSANLRSFTSHTVKLDSAIHQATITVDEKGTTAAAATALTWTRVGPNKFTADRPFAFLIVDNILRVPVVTGIYNGPTQE